MTSWSDFWRRQFDPKVTIAQVVFDTVFGIVLPVVCLAADPGVFRGTLFGPILPWPLAAWTILLGNMVLLVVWWVLGRRLRPVAALFGGAFWAGAFFAGLIALLLLPFYPLAAVGGWLVLVPAFTCFVLARNASRALLAIGRTRKGARQVLLGLLGAAILTALPTSLEWHVKANIADTTRRIIQGTGDEIDRAVEDLPDFYWYPFPLGVGDRIVSAYRDANDPARQQALSRAYRRLTGDDIEDRLLALED